MSQRDKSRRECNFCGYIADNKKERKAHRKICTREKPAKKQHFVFFHLPDHVILPKIDYDPGTDWRH